MGSIHPVEGKPPQPQLQLAHTGWDIGTPRLTRIGKSRRVIKGARYLLQLHRFWRIIYPKVYNCRQIFLLYDCKHPLQWFRSKDHGHGRVWTHLLGLNSIEGCNPSRYSLALPNESPMGFNGFSSRNGMRTTRWWESKACSIRSGFPQRSETYSPDMSEILFRYLYHWQYKIIYRCSW